MKKILLLSSVLFLTGCWQDGYYLVLGDTVIQKPYSSLGACQRAVYGTSSWTVTGWLNGGGVDVPQANWTNYFNYYKNKEGPVACIPAN